jgi:hypothetical protein
MPVPTSNNGSTFYNINVCRSFNQTINTAMTKLSSQPCSEVILINRTGSTLSAYDSGYSTEPFAMLLKNDDELIFRGLTNADQLSAKAATPGSVFYRTQYFSYNPSK